MYKTKRFYGGDEVDVADKLTTFLNRGIEPPAMGGTPDGRSAFINQIISVQFIQDIGDTATRDSKWIAILVYLE
jgi:hypothetical protein